ncbi:hypothetical protein BY996DRAFT_1002871 [Phakopsora pachyrhizi]|nr:hypothetical protein BY996DRAFT_1002871 [Phakopsora pachyrhizi]
MERMIPELRDLEQKKIFSKSEISAIVTQRNIHEASVIRTRSPKPYLRYIEYEKNLEKLRRLRFGKLGGHNVHGKGRITLSDYSIPLHILNLYSLAVKRFPESIELWLSYINYSLTQSSAKLVSRVLSAAIAAHPAQSRFWIMAVQFEADGDESGKGGGNIDGARKLLMRSLRFFNGTDSIPIWLEWIRIELNFVKVIEGRREALGIESFAEAKAAKNLESNQTSDNPVADYIEQTAMELDHVGDQYPEDLPVSLADDINSGELKGQEALLSGALVKVALSNAFKAVSDVRIFSEALPLIYSLDSPAKPSLVSFLYDNLAQLHPDSPKAVILLKTRRLFKYNKNIESFSQTGEELVNLVAETINEIQKECQKNTGIESSKMWEEFLMFLIKLSGKLSELREYIMTIILKTLGSLRKINLDLPRLHKLVIDYCRGKIPIEECMKLASKATKRYKDDPALSTIRLELILESLRLNPIGNNVHEEIFQEARSTFPGSVRIAELNVEFFKYQSTLLGVKDDKLMNTVESALEQSLKASTPTADDPTKDGCKHLALSPTEVYQRAYLDSSDKTSISMKINYLSDRSVLSLNFLRYILTRPDIGEAKELIESIHHKIISSYKDNKKFGDEVDCEEKVEEDWKSYLKFILKEKRDFRGGEILIEKSGSFVSQSFKMKMEEFWMNAIKDI